MTSGQKVAFSLLISVLAFCAFTVVAFSGLFDLLEVNFYQPVVQDIKQKKIEEIASAQNEYFKTLMKRFDSFTRNDDVKTYVDTRSSDSVAKRREILRTQLLEATSALKGIRIVAENGRNLFFSTFGSDLISVKKGISYKNYDSMDEISYSSLAADKNLKIDDPFEKKSMVFKDGEKGLLIFSLPFFNSSDEFAGSIFFYCDSAGFSQYLLNKNLIDISGFAQLVTPVRNKDSKALENFGGFVFGLPNAGQNSLKSQLLEKWRSPENGDFWKLIPEENPDKEVVDKENSVKSGIESLFAKNDDKLLCAFSRKPEREDFGFITFIYDESELKFPPYMRLLLLATAFVTLYLAVFLILSFKHDDIVIIRDKVRRYENEFFVAYKKMGETKSPAYLSEQKKVLERRILKSLGKKGEKYAAEFKSLFDGYWNEMLLSFGEAPAQLASSASAPIINADELKEIVRSSLEDILENGKIQIKADLANLSQKVEPKKTVEAVPIAETEPAAELDEVEPLEEAEPLEAVESLEEAAPADDVEEIEEVAEAEDGAEEIEEAEALEDAESVEEIEEAESLEPVEPAEEVESLEEAAPADDVEEIEEVGEAEEIEEAEALEDAESVEEVEEAESAEELDEVEPLEPVEPVEEVESLEEAAPADDVEEIEEVGEAEDGIEEIEEAEALEDAESVEEIEEAEPAKELDEAEPLEAVESLEPDESVDEVESLEEAEPVEPAEEVESLEEAVPADDVEEIEEVADAEEIEEAEALEDAESVEEIEEAESAEELDEAEPLEEAESLEPVESVDEVESLEEAEPVEPADDVEKVAEAEELDEVEPLEPVEPVDEVESLEKAEEVEPAEEVESLEEAAPADDVEEIEEVAEAEDGAEEIEEAEALEDAESVEEVEEAESADELDEAEPLEEVEPVEPLDEAEPLEAVEPVEPEESVDEVEPLEEAEPVEPAEEVESLEEAAPADDVEEIEEVGEADELADEIEELEEVSEAEEDSVEIDFDAVNEVESLNALDDEELDLLPEVDDSEYKKIDMERTLAALPERAPRWNDMDEVELDSDGLSRKLSFSEMHDIQKLKDAAKIVEEKDAELEELEVFDPELQNAMQKVVDTDLYAPHILDSNVSPDDDIYRDEALLEKIEFGVPNPETSDEETDDSVAEKFVAVQLDFTSLDAEDSDDKMYVLQPPADATENEHYFENPELVSSEETGELEALEEPEETMPFMFTKFAASQNSELMELSSDVDDAIVQNNDGTFRVTEMPRVNANIQLDMEFKKLVDSILR